MAKTQQQMIEEATAQLTPAADAMVDAVAPALERMSDVDRGYVVGALLALTYGPRVANRFADMMVGMAQEAEAAPPGLRN
jgi:hypothetical protein